MSFVLYDKKTGKVVTYRKDNTYTSADVGTRGVVERPWPPMGEAPLNTKYGINPLDPIGVAAQYVIESRLELQFADGKMYIVDLNDPDKKPVRSDG